MANQVQNVGFSDYSAEQADIERRRAYAQALSAEGQKPLEGQTAGGWAIPISPFQGLAKMLQSYTGRKGQDAASEAQKELGQKYQNELAQTLMRAQQAGTGTPASRMEGTELAPAFDTPAVPGNEKEMARILMGHPGTQALGMSRLQKDMDQQARQSSLASILGITGGGSAPSGDAKGGSSMFSGMPPQVVALMTSGDPELVKLGTTLMEANKGIAQRPGAPVVNPFTGAVIAQPTPAVPPGVGLQVGPGGPQAFPVAGAQGAMGALASSQAGAVEAGKAPYQLTTLNTEGAPTLMTHEQAIAAATGRPMQQPGTPVAAPQQQPQQPMGTTPPPQPGTPEYAAYSQVKSGAVPSAYVPQQQLQPAPQKTPGLRLQDQGESAQQKAYGAARGELLAQQPLIKRGLEAVNIGIDNSVKQIDSLMTDKGLWNITGPIMGRTPNITSRGTNAEAKLDTLKSQIGVQVLTAMREASKTGGAVGAVTEKEWPILQNQLGTLQQSQSEDAMKRGLQDVKATMERIRANAKRAYDDTYGNAQPAGAKLFAVNPSSGKRIMSIDGGETWGDAP